LHFHRMGWCEDCYFKGNAVFESNQVGITIHGTHGSKVEENTLWNPRAIGIYTEDGNEMHNRIAYNAIICADPAECHTNFQEFRGPGESMGGLYLIGMTNDIIGNHVAAHENGAWFNGAARPNGHGAAKAERFRAVCTVYQPFGKVQHNVFHDNARFGMYPDNQHPRNIKVNPETGYLTDPASCAAFLPDGTDNGADSPGLIEDQFDWHNMFVGQYDAGDIRWIRYVGVDNGASMYWKTSKKFKDGSLHHIVDSVFVSLGTVLPSLGKTCLSQLIAAGPFTFGLKNVTLLGGPTCGGALKLGQHCGHAGAGSPCNTQYLFDQVSWDLEPGSAKDTMKIKWGIFNEENDPAAEVAPVIFTRDGDSSLDGYRSIVSPFLNGFGSLPECQKLGNEWGGGYGCSLKVRRLNVWPLGGARSSFGRGNHMRDLELSGPGYGASPTWAYPTEGQNAGRMLYSELHRGFGLPVIVGRSYTLKVSSQLGDPVIEFSDFNLNRDFQAEEAITLSVQGGVSSGTCRLSGFARRPWMGVLGSKGLKYDYKMQGGCLTSSGEVPPPVPSPRPTPSIPAPQPPTSRPPTPVVTVPSPRPDGAWVHYKRTNCYGGNGGQGVPGKDPLPGDYTPDECKSKCLEEPQCVGVMVINNLPKFKCWLRKEIQLENCASSQAYDLWLLSDSPTGFVKLGDGGCRTASGGVGTSTTQTGVSESECRSACASQLDCLAIEYNAVEVGGRCELHTEAITHAASNPPYECFLKQAAPMPAPTPASVPAPRPSSMPAPTPATPAPPPSAAEGWTKHAGTNCFEGVGGEPVPGKDPMREDLTAAECRAQCEQEPLCAGVVVVNHLDKYKCWQRKSLTLDSCMQSANYDVWERHQAQTASAPAEGAAVWRHHQDLNCYGPGGDGVSGNNPAIGLFTASECKALCEAELECVGIVVTNYASKSKCWLRSTLTIARCLHVRDFDVWERPAPALIAPPPVATASSGAASSSWRHHPRTNCFGGVGGRAIASKDPVVGDYTLDECKRLCEEEAQCVGVVVVNSLPRYKCWLRKALEFASCTRSDTYDVWELA